MSGSPYMLVEDVAQLLGCSKRTVHERARLGEIPHRRPPSSRRLLFIESELRQWIDGAELACTELPRGGRVVKPA
jgi:excisionase family DNA binding protein